MKLAKTIAIAALPALFLVACETPAQDTAKVDSAVSTANDAKAAAERAAMLAEQAAKAAQKAAEAAERAAGEAKMAGDKADRIFRAGLRK